MWSRTTPVSAASAEAGAGLAATACARPKRVKSASTAGFTIIEALVALALVAVILAAIAPLMAASHRGVRAVEQHIALVSAARSIENGLPDRDQLVPGTLTGELAGNRWRVDVLPFAASAIDGGSPSRWTPQTVVITVRSPSGAMLRLNTVRLHRGSSE
jgi:general secretion pathway protein I